MPEVLVAVSVATRITGIRAIGNFNMRDDCIAKRLSGSIRYTFNAENMLE